MKELLWTTGRILKVFEIILKLIVAVIWAICLLSGGKLAFVAAILGIVYCAVAGISEL